MPHRRLFLSFENELAKTGVHANIARWLRDKKNGHLDRTAVDVTLVVDNVSGGPVPDAYDDLPSGSLLRFAEMASYIFDRLPTPKFLRETLSAYADVGVVMSCRRFLFIHPVPGADPADVTRFNARLTDAMRTAGARIVLACAPSTSTAIAIVNGWQTLPEHPDVAVTVVGRAFFENVATEMDRLFEG